MDTLADAALTNAEGFRALAQAMSAAAQPPPTTRTGIGTTPDGRSVTLVEQHGQQPRMKVGGKNRGGIQVRQRQEAQR